MKISMIGGMIEFCRQLQQVQQLQTVSSRGSYWSVNSVWKLHNVEMTDVPEMAPHVYKPTESIKIDSGHEAFLVR